VKTRIGWWPDLDYASQKRRKACRSPCSPAAHRAARPNRWQEVGHSQGSRPAQSAEGLLGTFQLGPPTVKCIFMSTRANQVCTCCHSLAMHSLNEIPGGQGFRGPPVFRGAAPSQILRRLGAPAGYLGRVGIPAEMPLNRRRTAP